MSFVRVTIILEPEDIHVWASERLELELPVAPEALKEHLSGAWLRAFDAMKREIERRRMKDADAQGVERRLFPPLVQAADGSLREMQIEPLTEKQPHDR